MYVLDATDRCGIYFDMADVDGAESALLIDGGRRLALKDVTSVRVTAIVKSDERVASLAERTDSAGSTRTIAETIRSEQFRCVTRHSSSVYADEATGLLRNDASSAGPMEVLANRLRQDVERLNRSVSVSVPWVDLSLRVGERIAGVDGRCLSFGTGAGDAEALPLLERVTYDFAGQKTDLGLRLPEE